jgi:hypothetical protein
MFFLPFHWVLFIAFENQVSFVWGLVKQKKKKATDILVQYGCTDNRGFIWAGQRTKTVPPPLGRTGGFNQPSFAKRRRREEGKASSMLSQQETLPASLLATFFAVRVLVIVLLDERAAIRVGFVPELYGYFNQ